MKWLPGHGVRIVDDSFEGQDGNTAAIAFLNRSDIANFNCINYIVNWATIEPSRGVYDFSKITNALNVCISKGKYLHLTVRYQSDNTEVCEGNIVPSYIQAYAKGIGKCAARIWQIEVSDAYALMGRALGDAFDLNDNLASFSISNESNPGSLASGIDTYSETALRSSLQRLFIDIQAHWPNTPVLLALDYPNTSTFIDPIIATIKATGGGGITWRDTDPSLDGVLLAYEHGKDDFGEIAVMPQGRSVVVAAGTTATEALYQYAIADVRSHCFFWDTFHVDEGANYLSLSVIPTVDSHSGAINTGLPSSLDPAGPLSKPTVFATNGIIEGALTKRAAMTRVSLLSGYPASISDIANLLGGSPAGLRVASATISGANFSLAAGSVSGRKSIRAEVTGTAGASGVGTHLSLDNGTDYEVVKCNTLIVVNGQSVIFASHEFEVRAPSPDPAPETDKLLSTTVAIVSGSSGRIATELYKHHEYLLLDGITVVDENRWSVDGFGGGTNPKFIELDLGRNYEIRRFTLHTLENRAYKFLIEGKVDNGAYASLVDARTNTQAGPIAATLAAPVNARAIKLTVTGATGYTGDYVSLKEFLVYGETLTSLAAEIYTNGYFDLARQFGNVISSSGAQPGNVETNLFDGIRGVDANRWSIDGFNSGAASRFVEIDLRGKFKLKIVSVDPYLERAYKWKVETKAAIGDSYTTFVDKTANTASGLLEVSAASEVTARYVKLTVTGIYNDTTDWVSLRSFEVYGKSAQEDVALYGSILSKSGEQSGNEASKAIDGTTGSDGNAWITTGLLTAPKFVEIDLGANYRIESATLDTYANRDYKFYIDAKVEGGDYAMVLDKTTNTSAGPISGNFANQIVRYIKLTVTGSTAYGGDQCAIRELQIFGSLAKLNLFLPPPDPPPPDPPPPSSAHPRGMNMIPAFTTLATKIVNHTNPEYNNYNTIKAYADNLINRQPNPQANYQLTPYYDNPSAYTSKYYGVDPDAQAAYSCGLIFYIQAALAEAIPSSSAYADRVVIILNAWANNGSFVVDSQTSLSVSSDFGPCWVNAAELIHDYPGWTSGARTTFKNWCESQLRPLANYKKLRSVQDNGDGTYSVPSYIQTPYDNNHNWWGLELSMLIARLNGDATTLTKDMQLFQYLIGRQVSADGSMQEEVSRGSQGLSYTCYALEGALSCAEIARNAGYPALFDYVSYRGGSSSLYGALTFCYDKGIENPSLWPGPHPQQGEDREPDVFAPAGRIYNIAKWRTYADARQKIPDHEPGIGFFCPTTLLVLPK